MRNIVTRFLIENLDIRGAVVQLDSTWQAVCAGREYPAAVQSVLGEMCAVSAIIATNLKQPARLTFQAQQSGPGLPAGSRLPGESQSARLCAAYP